MTAESLASNPFQMQVWTTHWQTQAPSQRVPSPHPTSADKKSCSFPGPSLLLCSEKKLYQAPCPADSTLEKKDADLQEEPPPRSPRESATNWGPRSHMAPGGRLSRAGYQGPFASVSRTEVSPKMSLEKKGSAPRTKPNPLKNHCLEMDSGRFQL